MKNKKPYILMFAAAMSCLTLTLPAEAHAAQQVPANLFNVGDSIGEAEAADGMIRSYHHDKVWSTGYAGGDQVNSFNERFAATCPTVFEANSKTRDVIFNQATAGQALLAEREWTASPWADGLQCSENRQERKLPWLFLLLR